MQQAIMSSFGDHKAESAVKDTSLKSSNGPLPLDELNALCLQRDVEFGLNYQPECTIEFDVVPLVILLAIPRKDRNPDDNPDRYLKAIKAVSLRDLSSVTLRTDMEAGNCADLANILKITQGSASNIRRTRTTTFSPIS